MWHLRTSRTFDVIFVISMVVLLGVAAINRIAIGDWLYFATHHPSTATATVATEAGLSPQGRRLFYRTGPVFGSRDEIAAACDVERLGCLDSRGQVYLLDQPGQHDQTVVTAAHEMLHLAYRRLSTGQRTALAPLLDDGIALNAENGISSELSHEQTDDDRHDEAHSLLGTEYQRLPPALEEYYAQYFADRSKVVQAEVRSEAHQ